MSVVSLDSVILLLLLTMTIVNSHAIGIDLAAVADRVDVDALRSIAVVVLNQACYLATALNIDVLHVLALLSRAFLGLGLISRVTGKFAHHITHRGCVEHDFWRRHLHFVSNVVRGEELDIMKCEQLDIP